VDSKLAAARMHYRAVGIALFTVLAVSMQVAPAFASSLPAACATPGAGDDLSGAVDCALTDAQTTTVTLFTGHIAWIVVSMIALGVLGFFVAKLRGLMGRRRKAAV
jgi:hypothetical protein